MLAPLISPFDADDLQLLALCIWREARGEPIESKMGIAQVIHNRIALAPREGFHNSVRGTILAPHAFTSFSVGDPNSVKFPQDMDKSWRECLGVASHSTHTPTDLVDNSVFY